MGLNHSPRIVTNGLVLCLDAGNRKSYPGSGTTWTDLSGNGNNGTLTNGPTFSGGNGGYFSFDGTDDHVTAPASFSLSNTSVSIWVYLDSTINWASRFDIFSTNIAPNTNGRFVLYRESPTILSLFTIFPSSNIGTVVQIDNADTLFTGKWKNVVITGLTVSTNTTLNVYIDGAFYGTLNVAEAATAVNSSCYFMRNQNGSYPTKGRLGICSVYNRALSAAEIQQNFNALRGRYGI